MEVTLSPFVDRSLLNIAEYIEYHFSPLVAFRAILAIRTYVNALGKHPYAGRIVDEWSLRGEVRCAIFRQNQIYYVVHPDHIIVIVVWDSRQSQERLRQVIVRFFEEYAK